MKRTNKVALAVLVVLCVPMLASAVPINRYIGYTGFLATGSPATPVTGLRTLVFKIYNVDVAGTALWTETQTVDVVDGEFGVNLGSITSLTTIDFNADTQYWLGITVGVTGTEMTPRKLLLFVPYSFRSDSVIEARTSDPASPVNGQIWLRTDL